MPELRVKIDEGFEYLDSDTWTNAYQLAQEYEQNYLQLADECELVSDSEDSEHDIVEDSDVSD
ncbi:hypothetical protein PC129_g13018 [Phytophthora cactorum]|uniref:Uncharacterized protein n=1 Tax=Phytophthora cactorum TaxID=29920 RepID=A0A329RTA4_9STRA|nr:hypothetical protein Pcac1_g24755 [Phytophthora cactorum]KAG2813460.1 hypothetical protein PC112_g14723 [Phytophthora cactorum]KAG2818873.1 hypothetical protein PC111_g12123 [Phytophthora cactorum]KAG2852691.1 hypothetical protein PC113_g14804 [Phytophthora cactorum]KAG2895077.1 hypothetical protein PC114_g15622 [Phytophthora cactorum]